MALPVFAHRVGVAPATSTLTLGSTFQESIRAGVAAMGFVVAAAALTFFLLRKD